MNILFDLNIIFDNYDSVRRVKYKNSVEIFDFLKNNPSYNIFISSSSLDNLKFIKFKDLRREHPKFTISQVKELTHLFIKEILNIFKIAKTPSYIDIDFEDIEDSQIIASANAINAKVITRDDGMLKKYPNITLHPSSFTPNLTSHPLTISHTIPNLSPLTSPLTISPRTALHLIFSPPHLATTMNNDYSVLLEHPLQFPCCVLIAALPDKLQSYQPNSRLYDEQNALHFVLCKPALWNTNDNLL